MPMLLSGIRLSTHGLDDVLAIEDADQAVDAGGFVEQAGLVALHEAPRHDHPLALAAGLQIDRVTNLLQ